MRGEFLSSVSRRVMTKCIRKIVFVFPILHTVKGQTMAGLVNNEWNSTGMEGSGCGPTSGIIQVLARINWGIPLKPLLS
jgi:hypothetical protein